jgi:hypothetical protein
MINGSKIEEFLVKIWKNREIDLIELKFWASIFPCVIGSATKISKPRVPNAQNPQKTKIKMLFFVTISKDRTIRDFWCSVFSISGIDRNFDKFSKFENCR